jgi:hypothetical protein
MSWGEEQDIRGITDVHCTTCHAVRGVEWAVPADPPTFRLICGHAVTLWPGALCGLDVRTDRIILYPDPDPKELPTRQEGR